MAVPALSMTKTQTENGPETLNIYKLSRLIKREQNDLYNSLRSIYADSLFVAEISRLYPTLPLLANLRCGIWYSPRFDGSCYFKSTDGHTGNWSFSLTRLNIHVAQSAAVHGGCIVVDATRRGKRYPDSLSKTVPIWCCVLNRALASLRDGFKDDGLVDDGLKEGGSDDDGLREGGLNNGELKHGGLRDDGLGDGFGDGPSRDGAIDGLKDCERESGRLADCSLQDGALRVSGLRDGGLRADGASLEGGFANGGNVTKQVLDEACRKEGRGDITPDVSCRTAVGDGDGPNDNETVRSSIAYRDFVTSDVSGCSDRGRLRGGKTDGHDETDGYGETDGEDETDASLRVEICKVDVEANAGRSEPYSGLLGAQDDEPGQVGVTLGDGNDSMRSGESGRETDGSAEWRELHLPIWLSATEGAAIEKRVDGWVEQLLTSGAELHPLAKTLRKPLRPLWISQRTVVWLNQVADVRTLPFTPVICLSASEPSAIPGHVSGNGSGWSYVAGAGDDEESWARGLTPALFWRNVHQIMDSGPSGCKGAVAHVVEEARVRAAMRSTGFGPGFTARRGSIGSAAKRVSDGHIGPGCTAREGSDGSAAERVSDGEIGSGSTARKESNGSAAERLSEESIGRAEDGLLNRTTLGSEQVKLVKRKFVDEMSFAPGERVARSIEGCDSDERQSDGAETIPDSAKRISDGAERVLDGSKRILDGSERTLSDDLDEPWHALRGQSNGAKRFSDGAENGSTLASRARRDCDSAGRKEERTRPDGKDERSDRSEERSGRYEELSDGTAGGPKRAGETSGEVLSANGCLDRTKRFSDDNVVEKTDVDIELADRVRDCPEGECSAESASKISDAFESQTSRTESRTSSDSIRKQAVEEQGRVEGLYQFDERGNQGSDQFGRFAASADSFQEDFGRWSFIGRTGLAVGSASCCDNPEVWRSVDAILDCCPTPHAGCAAKGVRYSHLSIQGSKFDRRSLERHLSDAVRYARGHLSTGGRLLVVCKDGYDVSVCVCLAILLSSFDSKGAYTGDRGHRPVPKSMVRQGLAFLSASHPEARPSRGNLKQVFQFVKQCGPFCDVPGDGNI